ncbi:MAG: ATP-binding protein [Porticoccaceae bacterium]
MDNSAIPSATRQNLRLLCFVRVIPLAGMFYGVYYLLNHGQQHLRWDFITLLLAAVTAVIAVTWLRSFRPVPISEREFFIHLMVDVALYSLLMFNTGGAENPFISYLLVPVTVAAITLPAARTWVTGIVCLGAYTALLFWYVPLPLVAPDHEGHSWANSIGLNPHLLGMWMNFGVSAVLIAYFINKMASALKAQDKALNRQKEKQLEDDQLLAVASLAASAAHELGTPLNTVKLICDEWRSDDGLAVPPDVRKDMDVLATQVERCQSTLRKLSGTARSYSDGGVQRIGLRDYFEGLMQNWQVLRPDVNARISMEGAPRDASIVLHPSLSASLHNLLNNAADASSRVDVTIHWDAERARLLIRDYGDGIERPDTDWRPLESRKPGGMGLGLFLAHSILDRHGGRIELAPHPEGGTQVDVILPLEAQND